MKLAIRSLILAGVVLGFLVGSGWGTPPVPDGATMSRQSPRQCGDILILRYEFDLPGGGTLVVFKEPNKDIRVWVKWSKNKELVAAYVGEKKYDTMDALIADYPDPCMAFFPRA